MMEAGEHRTSHPVRRPGHRHRTKELTAMNMWGLVIVSACIVLITVIMGLIATHGIYEERHHH